MQQPGIGRRRPQGWDERTKLRGLAAACAGTGHSSFMDSTSGQTARLRIVTPEPNTRPDEPSVIGPNVVLDCEGGYTCECAGCQRDRAALRRRGVRPLRPTYVKRERRAA